MPLIHVQLNIKYTGGYSVITGDVHSVIGGFQLCILSKDVY